MSHGFQSPRKQGQALLRTIESLNPALFVAGQLQRNFGQIEIKPDDVDNFLVNLWVIRDFERLRAVWLEISHWPYPVSFECVVANPIVNERAPLPDQFLVSNFSDGSALFCGGNLAAIERAVELSADWNIRHMHCRLFFRWTPSEFF